MKNGYEIIVEDDQWFVVNVWYNETKTTRLFEKKDYDIKAVLTWILSLEEKARQIKENGV